MKNEKIYNKLVRDRIPEVIEKTGKKYRTHIARELEYKEELFKKVYEELEEFKENPCAEEMADIFEVLEGLINAYNIEIVDNSSFSVDIKCKYNKIFCETLIDKEQIN